MNDHVLHVDNLAITLEGRRIVDDVSFAIARGEALALVGESGSGKTLTALSLLGLLPVGAVLGGQSALLGTPLPAAADHKGWAGLRGRRIGLIFQDALTSLNPVRSIGDLMTESLTRHQGLSRREARARATEALAAVGVPDPAHRFNAFAHELSGGQRQRAMIALALLHEPDLVIADEPTTALDASVQAQVLSLLRARLAGRAMLFITHDLAAASRVCDRVAVMRGGRILETGPVRTVLDHPRTDYARLLAGASVRRASPASGQDPKDQSAPILSASGLKKTYRLHGAPVTALEGASLEVQRGRTLAIVGESGSGKSTLARLLVGLVRPDAGVVMLDGAGANWADRGQRRRVQLVFQDPFASLDPSWRAGAIVAEPLAALGLADRATQTQRAVELLERVGLCAQDAARMPASFSGGERQRIAIARALAPDPDVLVADEPTSALDAALKGQVLDLLRTRQAETGLAIIMITHDLAMAQSESHSVCVLYLGEIVERGPTAQVMEKPAHPYTEGLLASAAPDGAAMVNGEAASPLARPGGCLFHPRCPSAQAVCVAQKPALREVAPGWEAACHFPHAAAAAGARSGKVEPGFPLERAAD